MLGPSDRVVATGGGTRVGVKDGSTTEPSTSIKGK